jgi:hypothetical protein
MANEIYPVSWWGSPNKDGWGSIYYDYIITPLTKSYEDRVIADGGIVEAISCVNNADFN